MRDIIKEMFIDLVRNESIIYDKSDPNYMNNEMKIEKFEVISQAIFQVFEENFTGKEKYIYLK